VAVKQGAALATSFHPELTPDVRVHALFVEMVRQSRMSGHSKWATTKHKKAALDAKRGKLFAKLIKNIEVACRKRRCRLLLATHVVLTPSRRPASLRCRRTTLNAQSSVALVQKPAAHTH
jgi:hypothetical protein